MKTLITPLFTLLCINVYAINATAAQENIKAHYDNVLGTSLDIEVVGVSANQAEAAIKATLLEIKRLENILSIWQENSQISQLNHTQYGQDLSPELMQIATLCEQWHETSNMWFSCRMGKLEQQWTDAQQRQVVPDRVAMRFQARDINKANLVIDTAHNKIELAHNIQLDPSGLAKGYIIDQASTYLRQLLPDVKGIKLDIGGDAYYWQHTNAAKNWTVEIAQPNQQHDNHLQQSRMTVSLSSKAIAASGHTTRFIEIERRRFSHILDPHDGWPMDNAPATVVIANTATIADAVATALATQPAIKGLDWVNTLPDVEALIMLADGKKITSDGWHQYLIKTNEQQLNPGHQTLSIKYTIPKIEALKYRKPYLAIWLTDEHEHTLRNLLLLGESSRWAKENTRWWRKVGRKNNNILDGLARPTRKPGEYELTWDGLDDFGQATSASNYILHIEAAREGGGHDYQHVALSFTTQATDLLLPSEGEIGNIQLHYQIQP